MSESTAYTKDFQVQLLAHMVRDEDFFKSIAGYVRLTDFGLPACQLIYEAVDRYYSKYRKLPDYNILTLEMQSMLVNADGKTVTYLPTELYDSLGYVMNEIYTMRTLNTQYFKDELSGYLTTIRVAQLTNEYSERIKMGQGASDYVEAMSKVKEQMSHAGGIELRSPDINPTYIDKAVAGIPTCLTKLNTQLSGGLRRTEIAMITACTGVGKTTAMINFMHSAVQDGHRALFLTLENPSPMIEARYMSIAAHIPASVFDKPMAQWTEEHAWRYSQVVSDKYRFHDRYMIGELSKRQHTVAEIDKSINQWKDAVQSKYGDVNNCAVVFVDWLDRIAPGGMVVSKNAREDQILEKICFELSSMARKHNIAIWTATQGTRGAVGKDVLDIKDVAQAYHKNDALDLSIGLGVVKLDVRGNSGTGFRNDDSTTAPECNRLMKWSIMKCRRGVTGVFSEFYQGPTLKFWDKRSDIAATTERLKKGEFNEIIRF